MEIVDPVPDLLAELTQTAEEAKAALAQRVETVRGVAADGVARVVVRVIPPGPGTVELALVDAAGTPLAPAEEAGFLTQVGDTVGSNSLFVPTVQVPDRGPMAFAIYHAPSRFARAGSGDANERDRQVSLRGRFTPQTGEAAQEATIPITIARPPVVLVHGLWGSEKSWSNFVPLITNAPFSLNFADYEDFNAAGLSFNTPVVGNQIKSFIQEFKTTEQVAAIQADVVAHSMGGLLVRGLPLLGSAFFRDDNFGLGDTHKLVTIGTPHFGSALARRVRRSACLSDALNAAGLRTDQGAVADMVPRSPNLELVNRNLSPIRMHTIVGIASPQQKAASQTSPKFQTLSIGCAGAIPPGGLDQIFRTLDHDLVVEAASQRGSFSPGALSVSTFGPFPLSDAVIHTRIPKLFIGQAELESGAIAQRVILLLNGVLESELFDFFVRPPGLR